MLRPRSGRFTLGRCADDSSLTVVWGVQAKAIFFFNEPAHTVQRLPSPPDFPVPTPLIFEGGDSVNRKQPPYFYTPPVPAFQSDETDPSVCACEDNTSSWTMLHCSLSYCCVMCPALFGPRAAPAVGSVKKKQDFVRLFKYVHIYTCLHPNCTAGDRNSMYLIVCAVSVPHYALECLYISSTLTRGGFTSVSGTQMIPLP
jgi:hypothetical protein